MRTVMNKTIRMPIRYVILLALVILLAVTLYIFYGASNPKLATLVAGVSGGLIVYIVGFILSIYEYKSIDRFRRLGVKEVLSNRRGIEYYRKMVGEAREHVLVIGTSCSRFIDDFANEENNDHVLLDALRKNNALKVRFLVPDEQSMDVASRSKFSAGEEKLRNLLKAFPDRVEMRRFNHQPRYSFVRVDVDLIVGPVFAERESKDSPAIHLDVESAFAEKYLADFDRVWKRSQAFQ